MLSGNTPVAVAKAISPALAVTLWHGFEYKSGHLTTGKSANLGGSTAVNLKLAGGAGLTPGIGGWPLRRSSEPTKKEGAHGPSQSGTVEAEPQPARKVGRSALIGPDNRPCINQSLKKQPPRPFKAPPEEYAIKKSAAPPKTVADNYPPLAHD